MRTAHPRAPGRTRGVQDRGVNVSPDSPAREDVLLLLDEHLTDMFATSPAESVHALDHSALLAPTITFWTARDDDGTLLGCGAGSSRVMKTLCGSRV